MTAANNERLKLFIAYRDAPERRAALRAAPDDPERYRLFGLDEFRARGAAVHHNLERAGGPPALARAADRVINVPLYRLGGYGGDFASVLASRRRANDADVVLATVDTVGLPLALLKRARLVSPRLVYISVGLPERLVQLRGERMIRRYREALATVDALIAYSVTEAEHLKTWLGEHAPRVEFVPFGVDTDAFRPDDSRSQDVDVLSIGADPRRDFELLLEIAGRHPDRSFRIVASTERARALPAPPPNVTLETDIGVDEVRDRIARSRVVALPVRENTYSGATTTLLQAMAMAKPAVVSRTEAIATGYHLEDGINCRLVAPGDVEAFERTLLETLTGADAAISLGIRARETVVRSLSWERYTDALWRILSAT